jgi:amino acid adenylation domain-containing protein/non-ribosomal peptide synthase protein (TIGR01720 family)
MIFVAVVNALLARYSGHDDVTIGAITANRMRSELDDIVGFFVNIVPLRVRVDCDDGFDRLLENVRNTVLEAFDHQDAPHDIVINRLLKIGRPDPHLFEVLVTVQNVPIDRSQIGAAEATLIVPPLFAARADLAVEITTVGEGIRVGLEYDAARFDPVAIARLADNFRQAIVRMVGDPATKPVDLDLSGQAERHDPWRFGRKSAPDGTGETVLARIDRHVVERPLAPALRHAGLMMTYADLHQASVELASSLPTLSAHDVVGVLLPRGIDLVVATLAVLRAGGSYLCVDPDLPSGRIATMLNDVAAAAVITIGSNPLQSQRPRVNVDDSRRPSRDRLPAPLLSHTAYVTYTSGSSGEPKAVVTNHLALLALCDWAATQYEIDERDVVSQIARPSFDAYALEAWPCLAAGACLHVIENGPWAEGPRLRDWLIENHVAVAFVPTPIAAPLLQIDWPGDTELRYLLTGGDRLTTRPRSNLPFRVWNNYGPTECSVVSTAGPVSPNSNGDPPDIGGPIHGVKVCVLDARLRPVPDGAAGELYIGGDGVSAGYLNQPSATAERFLPDPYGPPGSRMYATGDRVRWNPRGNLDFLGRLDDQLKVRGIRIEPGEIEHAMRQIDGVEDAAVVLCGGTSEGDAALTAYFVANSAEDGPQVAQLLREQLPTVLPRDYIPRRIVALAALPTTPNGKIDRRSLQAMAADRPVRTTSPAPLDKGQAVESGDSPANVIATIWRRALDVDVTAEDNFFALGGDSLLAVKVVGWAADAGWAIEAGDIFETGTLAELAALAQPLDRSNPRAGIDTSRGPVPLSPTQRWFFQQFPDGSGHPLAQVIVCDLSPDLDLPRIQQALSVVLRRHEAFQLRFERSGREWTQLLGNETVPVDVRTFSLISPDAEADLADEVQRRVWEITSRLNIETGEVLKAAVLTGHDSSRLLVVIAHHLVVDAYSWRVLAEEVSKVVADPEAALPPVTNGFATWARSVARAADKREWTAEKDYYQEVANARLTTMRHEAMRSGVVRRETVSGLLEPKLTAFVTRDLPARGYPVTELLTSATLTALGEWSGQWSHLVSFEGHGRNPIVSDLPIPGAVGWFTCYAPVAVDLEPGGNVANNIARVASSRAKAPNEGMTFSAAVWADADIATLATRLPMPSLNVNYLGQFDASLREAGLRLSPLAAKLRPCAEDQMPQLAAVELTASVIDGRLRLQFVYLTSQYESATVEAWAHRVLEIVQHFADTSSLDRLKLELGAARQ